MESELKNDKFVGENRGTHNLVGLRAIDIRINSKLLYAVRNDPLCGFKKSGCFGHIASGVFQGIDD
jgi:hypothetical protein